MVACLFIFAALEHADQQINNACQSRAHNENRKNERENTCGSGNIRFCIFLLSHGLCILSKIISYPKERPLWGSLFFSVPLHPRGSLQGLR